MTEKRYVKENFYDEYAIKKEDTIIAIVDSGTNARKICNELNALNDENEQLKQTNQKLYDNLQETIGHLALKSGIEKENEQLNKSRDELISENRHIKKTIQTMLINERTAIGKSVLKQLWNAIHME